MGAYFHTNKEPLFREGALYLCELLRQAVRILKAWASRGFTALRVWVRKMKPRRDGDRLDGRVRQRAQTGEVQQGVRQRVQTSVLQQCMPRVA